MKKLNKKILVLSLILLMGIITIGLNNKKELNIKDNSKKLAVYIKQDDGSYKEANTMPSLGYTLNNEKSICSNGAKPTWNNNGLNIANLTSNDTNCYLYFDSDAATKKLKELGLTSNTTTPDFSQTATTDEGIFGAEDGMYGGTSYYWRGAATTNYVRFAGFCWRAIRINGDGSLRLIYDGATCHQNGESTVDSIAVSNVAYNVNSNRSEYVGWTYVEGKQRPEVGSAAIDSNVKIKIEEWYNANIGSNITYTSKVASGKYCNDREVGQPLSGWNGFSTTWSATGTKFVYIEGKRQFEDYNPVLSCTNMDIYELHVGQIMADEAAYAGAVTGIASNSYYLYNGQSYWTMSPYRWDGNRAYIFLVNSNGVLGHGDVSSNTFGLRPVINLRSDVTFTGNGTIDNPFVVEGV